MYLELFHSFGEINSVMDINELKIEKVVLLAMFVLGMILFIDYTFGISNIIQLYYNNNKLASFKRETFLMLYTVCIIPSIGFYSLCVYMRKKKESAVDYLFSFTQPFLTFTFGFYLYKLFEYYNLQKSINSVLVIFIQYIFSC